MKTLLYNQFWRLLLIADFFMLVYWNLFIIGFSDLVTSLSLCIWFFTKKKDTVLLPVSRAIRETLFYHLGTILITVLLTPFCSVLRFLFGSLKNALKGANQKNNYIKFTINAFLCCLIFYDKFFRFISYHNYVQVALWSNSYWKSCKKSFFLINRHNEEIRNIEFLQTFVILQTKVIHLLYI